MTEAGGGKRGRKQIGKGESSLVRFSGPTHLDFFQRFINIVAINTALTRGTQVSRALLRNHGLHLHIQTLAHFTLHLHTHPLWPTFPPRRSSTPVPPPINWRYRASLHVHSPQKRPAELGSENPRESYMNYSFAFFVPLLPALKVFSHSCGSAKCRKVLLATG